MRRAPGASAADAASEPDTPLHSTDMRDRSEKPTQSALAKPDRATVLQWRSHKVRDAGRRQCCQIWKVY
jgi:hypothetical protein